MPVRQRKRSLERNAPLVSSSEGRTVNTYPA
jgi:hypothetical protein